VAAAQTVPEVLARLGAIDAELPTSDGVHVFNRVYLTVTERVAALLELGGTFEDIPAANELDVRFARLWLAAYDAAAAGGRPPSPWRPLFEARHGANRFPIQFALAGINAHIENDLPLALVRTCRSRGTTPDDSTVRHDFDAINDVLADVEAEVRRSFLDEVGRAADDVIGPVTHLISAWSIDKARDAAFLQARTIWELRHTTFLREHYVAALGDAVGMASRLLLAPVP
jgi:Family of unknown function (DUF5995)